MPGRYERPQQRPQKEMLEYRYDLNNSLNHIQQRKYVNNDIYGWVEACVYAFAIIVLIFTLLIRTATVSGWSMYPTLSDGERLVLEQQASIELRHGDIIVVDRTFSGEEPIIKRVIGVAGDEIDIDFQTGEVWRNGQLLDEPYINEATRLSYNVQFPVTVPENAVFVLGDNRNNSLDSRSSRVGMVDLRSVIGRVILRFYPVDEFGRVE